MKPAHERMETIPHITKGPEIPGRWVCGRPELCVYPARHNIR